MSATRNTRVENWKTEAEERKKTTEEERKKKETGTAQQNGDHSSFDFASTEYNNEITNNH